MLLIPPINLEALETVSISGPWDTDENCTSQRCPAEEAVYVADVTSLKQAEL
jgi:hypothetical protein